MCSDKLCIILTVYKLCFILVTCLDVSEYLPVYLTPFVGVVFRYVLIRTWQGMSQASGPQVWIFTMFESPISVASYYCPFALIRCPTRVSVRVCNIVVDPRVLGVLHKT